MFASTNVQEQSADLLASPHHFGEWNEISLKGSKNELIEMFKRAKCIVGCGTCSMTTESDFLIAWGFQITTNGRWLSSKMNVFTLNGQCTSTNQKSAPWTQIKVFGLLQNVVAAANFVAAYNVWCCQFFAAQEMFWFWNKKWSTVICWNP